MSPDVLPHRLAYRLSESSDISAMARIRAASWGTEQYWRTRIAAYLNCSLYPRQALKPRVCYVALLEGTVVGLIAGHLTRRYGCHGELEWIDVDREHLRSGIASELLRLLAAWFRTQKAWRICVDVEPSNVRARSFYFRHGARSLNKHWLVWNDISAVLGR